MLSYCRNWWPSTTSIKKLPNKETITFLDRGNVNGHVSTRDVYECVEAAYFSTTKRISYWSGKVNQHTSDGIWQTDADGTSGANIDMLAYCRKYFPLTGSVVKSDRRETITFWTRGNAVAYETTKDVYECVEATAAPSSSPTFAPSNSPTKVADANAVTLAPTMHPTVAPTLAPSAAPTFVSTTKRISYWYGKVNQRNLNGEWLTDEDGVSGGL